ncbi:phosphatase PAP2 family protein [Chryseobacterium sp. SIMBA_029]|uniref:phosphatase PAP2 family protein n=2 Tax=Bacteria TaxID=2 RepID=UPI00397E6456
MDDEIFGCTSLLLIKPNHVQESEMDEKRIKSKDKLYALLICAVAFTIIYNTAAWYISTLENISSFVFSFEKYIPFVPWTIIPYLSSGTLFCLVFLLCYDKKQLKLLTQRMLFVTVIAGICFVLFPLRFSLQKPDIGNAIFGYSFQVLKTLDSPFNQSPSLHIAYAFIFWTIFRNFNQKLRLFSMIWLIALGISTLTTYQHHFIDIITGIILAHISFIVFPDQKNNFRYRNFQVANFYFLSGWIIFSISLFLNQFFGRVWLLLLWPALVMLLTGYHYQKNAVHFLKDKNGNIPVWKKIFYAPYQLIYYICWKWLRKNKAPIEIMQKIYISSRLSTADVQQIEINENTFVYDLSAELEETSLIKERSKYYSVPFLDIGTFDVEETKKLVHQITENYQQLPGNGKILIHCTMGFTRSSSMGTLVIKNILSLPLDQTITHMKSVNKNAIIHSYAEDFLKYFTYYEQRNF